MLSMHKVDDVVFFRSAHYGGKKEKVALRNEGGFLVILQLSLINTFFRRDTELNFSNGKVEEHGYCLLLFLSSAVFVQGVEK